MLAPDYLLLCSIPLIVIWFGIGTACVGILNNYFLPKEDRLENDAVFYSSLFWPFIVLAVCLYFVFRFLFLPVFNFLFHLLDPFCSWYFDWVEARNKKD